jgi:hydrogenase expression/formation protein HypE
MVGAEPAALSLALIIEEGFPIRDLVRILESVRSTANEAGVAVVTGDTKVVEKGGY